MKYCVVFVFFITIIFCTTMAALANRYAAIVVHASTGKVLHSRSADSYRYPASITKIMTLYMLFEAIENGSLSMNSKLKVSLKATRVSPSKLYLDVGDTICVYDAIGTLITKSANDVAIVVAEAIGKNEVNFAKMMTEKARKIGMNKTTFRNASGLYHSQQRTTARDIATLAQRIRIDFPQYYSFFSMKNYSYRGTIYYSNNKLLGKYPGIEGMKTGYIHASGFNLVATASRNHQRLITVVLGAQTQYSRDKKVTKLLDLGFSRIMPIVKAPLPSKLWLKTRTQNNKIHQTQKLIESMILRQSISQQLYIPNIIIPKVLPRITKKTQKNKSKLKLNFEIIKINSFNNNLPKNKINKFSIPLKFFIIK